MRKIKNMKKSKIIILSILIFTSLVAVPLVSAHCPLCTAAAGAGVGVARFYGVDDSIVGLLLGGFVASSGLWVHNWLKNKKKINIPVQGLILVALSFLLLAVPLYTAGVITDFEMVMSMPEHHSMLGMGVYGIDKLLFGLIVGTILISGTFTLSDSIKAKRGKRLFAFQGLVFMLTALAIFSLIFWLLI